MRAASPKSTPSCPPPRTRETYVRRAVKGLKLHTFCIFAPLKSPVHRFAHVGFSVHRNDCAAAAGFCARLPGFLLAYVLVCNGKAHASVRDGKAVNVTAVAIVLGACAGALSVLPFAWGLRRVRTMTVSDDALGKTNITGLLLLVAFASAVILFGCAIAVAVLARDVLLPFAVAEIVVLTASTISFSIWRSVRK